MNIIDSKKTVLVTGSNTGIGYATLEGLLQKEDDFNLIMTSRNLSSGEEAIEELQNAYPSKGRITLLQLDLDSEKSIKECIESLKDTKIDIFINNAGVFFEEENPETIRIQWQTNYRGTRLLTDLALQNDIINQNGKIIFLSSRKAKICHIEK